MTTTRQKSLNLKVSQEELAVLHQVAGLFRQDLSSWLRCAAASAIASQETPVTHTAEITQAVDSLWGPFGAATWKARSRP